MELKRKNRNDIVLTDKMELCIIELDKVLAEYNKNKKDEKAQWMMFINNPNDSEVQEIMKENKEIKEATVEIVKMSQDEKIRKLAELREKAIMDEKATFRAGIKKEKKSGIQERNIEIAKMMKEEGDSIEKIQKITGLDKEEIENL